MATAAQCSGDGARKSKSVSREPVDNLPSPACQSNRNRGHPAERILFRLCPGWSVGYDPHQWMLLRANMRLGKREWQPVAFVATEKRILLRAIEENGVQPTPEAQAALDALPSTFREWVSQSQADSNDALLKKLEV